MKITRREMTQLLGGGLIGSALPVATGSSNSSAGNSVAPAGHELLWAPASEIARALRERRLSSEELTQAYLERIEAINPQINAIVYLNAERAMAAAGKADAQLAGGGNVGPLHGVPMTLKDSIDTAGVVTTWGTLGRRDHVPADDATVAHRLKAAGAILLGKTNTPEFTLSFETDNLVYGRTKNPFDHDASPGGSSGGAAAAVTSALCAFDIGSDTGGSIRVPSHCCGTAGLKPTQGRVPRTGHAVAWGGLHDPLTQLGPIARSVGDLELLLGIIAGPDGRDPFIPPVALRNSADVTIRDLRIGWHGDNGIYSPTAEIQSTVANAARALREVGSSVREIIPPPMPATMEEFDPLFVWTTDGGAWIQRLLDGAGTRTAHPAIAGQINDTYLQSAGELTRLIEARDQFRGQMLAFMQDYDVMVTPVCGFPAPLFGETEDVAHLPGYSYTQVYNLSGLPVVVVRCGTSPQGLPIGVQVAAAPWREDIALAVAKHLERTFGGWKAPV